MKISVVTVVLVVGLVTFIPVVVSSDDTSCCPHMHMSLDDSRSCVLIARVPLSYARAESACLAFSDYLLTIENLNVWNVLVEKLRQLRLVTFNWIIVNTEIFQNKTTNFQHRSF